MGYVDTNDDGWKSSLHAAVLLTSSINRGDLVDLLTHSAVPNPGWMDICTLDGSHTRLTELSWSEGSWVVLTDQLTLDRERYARSELRPDRWFHYRFRDGEPVPTEDGDGMAGDLLADDRLTLVPRNVPALVNADDLTLIDRIGNQLTAGRSVPDPVTDRAATFERITWMDGQHLLRYEKKIVEDGLVRYSYSRRIFADRPTHLRLPETFETVDIEEFEEMVPFAALDIPDDWDD